MREFYLDTAPFSFRVFTNSRLVIDNLFTIYGAQVAPAESLDKVADYSVTLLEERPVGRFFKPLVRFLCDQREPFLPMSADKAYAMLEWGMNWVIAAHEMQHVLIHSAVLAKNNKAVIFPAPPGSGKSTLTSSMLKGGWRLLSDEMAVITPYSLKVSPFVRPVCLKNNSIQLARQWFADDCFSTIARDTHKGDVIHLRPTLSSWQDKTTTATVSAVIFPKYTKETFCEITEHNKQDAFLHLSQNAFNYGVLGEHGFRTLCQICEEVPVFSVSYNSVDELQAFIEEALL